jgi:hypothetical protein
MKRFLLAFILFVSTVAVGEIWCGTVKYHPSQITLWRKTPSSFKDGNSLYDHCSHANASMEKTDCLGYITGVSDVFAELNVEKVCFPKGVIARQVTDVVTNYLRDHPAERHYSAVAEIYRALARAFPCAPAR